MGLGPRDGAGARRASRVEAAQLSASVVKAQRDGETKSHGRCTQSSLGVGQVGEEAGSRLAWETAQGQEVAQTCERLCWAAPKWWCPQFADSKGTAPLGRQDPQNQRPVRGRL